MRTTIVICDRCGAETKTDIYHATVRDDARPPLRFGTTWRKPQIDLCPKCMREVLLTTEHYDGERWVPLFDDAARLAAIKRGESPRKGKP